MTEFDAFSRNSPYGAVTSGALQGVAITDTNGTSHFGHYNKLETPFKLQVGYLAVDASIDTRRPGNVAILGSNDDENWDLLYTNASVADTRYNNFIVNSTKGYKYHMFMVKNLDPYGEGALYIDRLQYYGHRAGDLVRFPDSVNVLKYPHVAMTGPAQRGYVVSGSTHSFIQSSNSRDDPWRAFEGPTDVQNWKTNEMYTTAGVYSPSTYSRTASSITDTGSTQHSGEYLVLETPHKIKLSSWEVKAAYAPRRIVDYAILGSDTNSSSANKTGWTLLTNGTFAAQETVTATVSSPTTAFKYHAIVVKSVTNHSDSRRAQIDEMKLYGTEPGDVVARVGDGFDGKVHNLRVYSTALSDARVQEIFDADKDEFGLAKSSVSVHRGHLGVGTDTPEAALTVMDEVAELGEFPPRAMSGYETYMEGHGNFKVSASEEYAKTIAGGASGDEAWTMFDKQNTNWTGGASYTGTSYTYAGTHTSGGYGGDYIELKLPYKIKLEEFIIQPSSGFLNRWSKSGVIVAKNTNDDAWTNIFSWSGSSVASSDKYNPVYFRGVDTSNAFDTFRLVITSVDSQPYVTLFQWRLFGTREQGASTLHNGELSLTRNLTVPRIGPPLDADDTPRRDRLVVEYNTSTNPTENGTVKDTSGRGNDGLFYGGASYDATEKAITLSDGTDDYVESGKTIIARGTPQHTFSFWLKPSTGDHDDTVTHYLVVWGSETSQNKWSGVGLTNDGALSHVYHSSGKFTTDKVLSSPGVWYHVAVVVNSTSATTAANRDLDFYINGKSYTGTYNTFGSNNANSAYYLDWGSGTYTSVRLGSIHNSNEDSSSSLSTIKIYDVALTADEVKRLYDMGRCDEGHHVVNFSKTRVGIGLGDGEVSDALLNVGGVPYGRGAKPCFCASRRAGNVSSGNTIIFDHVEVNQQNGYNSTTGTFTAPVSGLYLFSFYGMSNDTGNSFGIRAYKNGDTYEMFWPYTHHHAGSPHKHVSGTQIVPMNTGDTFLFKVQAATLYGGSNGHNSFVGYLIE
jgi:hypothetical protein